MPQKIKLESGEEVDVFTKAEVDEQVAKEKENLVSKEELNALKAELETKEAELAGLANKDMNFRNLKDAQKKSEQERDDLKKQLEEKINKNKEEVLTAITKSHYDAKIDELASGDIELKKKIEYHYKRIQDVASTKDEVAKKLEDASLLAGRGKTLGVLNSRVISSANPGRPFTRTQGKDFSPGLMNVASKLGITNKDLEKHA